VRFGLQDFYEEYKNILFREFGDKKEIFRPGVIKWPKTHKIRKRTGLCNPFNRVKALKGAGAHGQRGWTFSFSPTLILKSLLPFHSMSSRMLTPYLRATLYNVSEGRTSCIIGLEADTMRSAAAGSPFTTST